MASAVVCAAFRLPLTTRRLSNSAPLIRQHRSTPRTGEIVAVVETSRNDENSAEKHNDVMYCDPHHIDSMHKVSLEVKGETQMMNLTEKIKAGGISHKLWMEQPENIPTCIATKPYPKSQVSPFLKKLKLCK
ncbi:hypothetical protein N665_0025s0267 [Sinapis alba]|nr:hypothetical protein N665_0025s0267 [Sinapis alba]